MSGLPITPTGAIPWEERPADCHDVGDVPNVVFPCATLSDQATGRLASYYGAADTTVALAYNPAH